MLCAINLILQVVSAVSANARRHDATATVCGESARDGANSAQVVDDLHRRGFRVYLACVKNEFW